MIVRNISRAAPEVVSGLAGAGAATVHEALGRRGFVGPQIRPIQTGARIAGNAVTVLCGPGDNLMIHAAVEVCQQSDVLVVTTTEPSSHGMVGELLATSLMTRGVRGLVIEAGVRDTEELRELGFPVWTRYVSCQGTTKDFAGAVNVPITLGDVTVNPGDVVCADDDGVVVVPREEAESCLESSTKRLAREETTRARLAAGELGLDFYGLRSKLADLGVEVVDSADTQ